MTIFFSVFFLHANENSFFVALFSSPHRTELKWQIYDSGARESNQMICVGTIEKRNCLRTCVYNIERASNLRWVRFMPFVLNRLNIWNVHKKVAMSLNEYYYFFFFFWNMKLNENVQLSCC